MATDLSPQKIDNFVAHWEERVTARIPAEAYRTQFTTTAEDLAIVTALQIIRQLQREKQELRVPFVDVVFDGPPDHASPRFVEVENEAGRSINAGSWINRDDGYYVLRINLNDTKHD